MEVIDIGLDNLEPVDFNLKDTDKSTPSVNFGPGVELLMNENKISSNASTKVDMGDLDNLEDELNNLSKTVDSAPSSESAPSGGNEPSGFSKVFSLGSESEKKIDIGGLDDQKPSNVGSATIESMGTTKTWDGFSKTNEIPVASTGAKMSEREKRRKKRAMIKKLDEWYEKGLLKHYSKFNMESDYDEVEDEYETAMEDKRKKDSVKLQGWWLTTLVNSLEYGNALFDPFGLNLDGWGEQINEDIESYEDIFSELHDKYKGGKLSPEISLLLRLGFSGAVLNITNKALSTATPGFNDVIKQSPELMKMFSTATAETMNKQSPGFDFVNSVLHPDEQVNTSFGAPPPPVETKNQAPPPRPKMQYTNEPNRPDIAMGRGAMFQEEGVDVSSQFEKVNTPPASTMPSRVEMKGPSASIDVDGLLSGLKTRDIDIAATNTTTKNDDNDSMISVTSLRDNQNTVQPKRTRRKQRSDKNIVAIDI